MTVWEKLQHNLNANHRIKEAEFKYVSSLFAETYIKTAEALGFSSDDITLQLKNLDDAYRRAQT